MAGKYTLQGNSQSQVKQPEVEARDRVVVARIAQVQKTQQLLVDEEEPKKPVILSRPAVQGEGEVRRIAQASPEYARARRSAA